MVARGTPIFDRDGNRAACEVDFGIQTPKFSSGDYTVDLRADDRCAISINEITDHTLPPIVAASNLNQIGYLARLLNRLVDFLSPRLSAVNGPKRTTNYTWMYGYGGTWDWLSEVRGFVDFSWDGSGAFINYVYSWCQAHNSTGWWNQGCFNIFNQYNGGWVEQLTDGGFFWAPNGLGGTYYYQHHLRNDRQGDQYGNGSCSGYYNGSIVAGATMKCEVVQPPPCGAGNICFSEPPHS